ncbi:MAG: hypothetical protein LBS51_08825 [Oscillospiraceae bacterium]|jgi:hypothetical protein|nr:hypothetical protein [Oscillospiraceae bacterium]
MRRDHGGGKNLYVVLSRSATALSWIIHTVRGDEYTHAALALDERLEYMFSFGRRRAYNPFIGCFKRENLNDALYNTYPELPGAVIRITVSAAQYECVTDLIESFLLNSHLYGYNYLGLVGNLWGQSRPAAARFFCSEFVYHVLHASGICDFGKPRGLVRPQDLTRVKGRVVFKGNLKEYDSLIKREIPAALNIAARAEFVRCPK